MEEVEATQNKDMEDKTEIIMDIIEKMEKLHQNMTEDLTAILNEVVKIVLNEKNEELKKVTKKKNEELKKLTKKKNEELKKVTKKKNEELKKVITEKDEELEKVIKEKDKKLEEERCDLEELEDMNSALLIKERQSNDEIQEARKELIEGLKELSGEGSTIGVKKMGEVDEKPFVEVCQQRFSGENVAMEHALLSSKWKENIRDSAWYPFKRVGTGGKMKEVVDEEDGKLKTLREEWGEDVKNAVKTALEELNEFNPSGRYPVPVLWNLEQGRKATLKEGIAHMMQQVRDLKRKRT